MSLTQLSIAALVLLIFSFVPSSTLPFEVEPIALAVALYLWLTVVMNVSTKIISGNFRNRAEKYGLLLSLLIATPISLLILSSSDQFAVVAWVFWQILFALSLGFFIYFGSDPRKLPSRWSSDDPKAAHAIALQAGGLGIGALVGMLLARYAGPIYFIIFMLIGLKIFRFLLDEVIYAVVHGISVEK